RRDQPLLLTLGDRLELAQDGVGALLAPAPLQGRGARGAGPRRGARDVGVAGPGGARPRRLLAAELLARAAGDGLRDVAEQLGDADLAVAVAVAGARDAAQQVVGEQAVLQLGRLQRLLPLVAGSDQEAALAGDGLQHGRPQFHVALAGADRVALAED